MYQRFVEKALHGKAVENRIKLNVTHFRIPKVKSAAYHFLILSPDLYGVRGRIVLHLLSGDILMVITPPLRILADPLFPELSGQCGVSDVDSVFFSQFFMDSVGISFAGFTQRDQKVIGNIDFIGSLFGLVVIPAEYGADSFDIDSHQPGDLFFSLASSKESSYGGPGIIIYHREYSSIRF
jgi:hypothetical protein